MDKNDNQNNDESKNIILKHMIYLGKNIHTVFFLKDWKIIQMRV